MQLTEGTFIIVKMDIHLSSLRFVTFDRQSRFGLIVHWFSLFHSVGVPWKVHDAPNARPLLGAQTIKLTHPTRTIWNSRELLRSRALLIVPGHGLETHRMAGTVV